MQMTETLRDFIREHIKDDVFQLVLNASHYEGVNVRFAAEQIMARQRIKDKLPSWYANESLVFPSALSAEQCSSEKTAKYKQCLVDSDVSLCDLTGGLGVDSIFFARKVQSVIYVERNAEYFDAACYNFGILNIDNVKFVNDDAEKVIPFADVDVFYLDPARRGAGNKRVFAIEDCEPDLTVLWPLLRNKRCKKIIVKLSPMLDIKNVLSTLPDISEVHVVSVKNDCKELLVVSSFEKSEDEPVVKCVNFASDGSEQNFSFRLSQEYASDAIVAKTVGKYLYEPNASILKAGAYKTLASHLGLEKLDVSSHLYTSNSPVDGFPGRIFEVVDWYPFDNRLCRELSGRIPQANISVRNFPLCVDELRKRLHIADGGETYLFATTLNGKKIIVQGRRMNNCSFI